jgi:DNA-binding NarL/FixJ family response regulator
MEQNQTTAAERIRVLVADNSRIHTQLLADALNRDNSLDVIRLEADSHGLFAAVRAHQIEVLVISSTLDEEPQRGLAVLRELRGLHPVLATVVLLDSSRPEDILDAFRTGARGIFNRFDSIDMLSKCIRRVHQGQIWANSGQLALAMEALASSPTVRAVNAHGLNLLSKREMEVVRSLAEGLTNREIAERLGLSQHTIKNYLFRVFDKLGVSSRVELLFMTLSQENEPQSALQQLLKTNGEQDGDTLAECREAAEQGAPIAQLALAQLYLAKKTSSEDVAQAYMWYSIASEQISRTRSDIKKMLTMEQRVEAEEEAADRLRRSMKLPSSSISQSGKRQTASGGGDFPA